MACIKHAGLGEWVTSNQQEYLGGEEWLGIVESSIESYRNLLATGLPRALEWIADSQVWGGGFVVSEVWKKLSSAGAAGIARFAIDNVTCADWQLGDVEAE